MTPKKIPFERRTTAPPRAENIDPQFRGAEGSLRGRFQADRPHLFWIIAGCVSVAGIGVADYATGREVSFSLFYLVPIMAVSWYAGRNPGAVISVLAAAAWIAADEIGGQTYSLPFIRYWNAAVRFGFFMIVAVLLPVLKSFESEKRISRVDHLTGVGNRRHFFEAAHAELSRSGRYNHSLTLVYFDLDGFKKVNDRLGHLIGDRLLCAVVNRAKDQLRNTDILARLGGDEFVILLPQTGEAAARAMVPRVHAALLDEMRRNDWPVTFSIGTLTCQGAPANLDELIRCADDLMYSVKTGGKNSIAYAVYEGGASSDHRADPHMT